MDDSVDDMGEAVRDAARFKALLTRAASVLEGYEGSEDPFVMEIRGALGFDLEAVSESESENLAGAWRAGMAEVRTALVSDISTFDSSVASMEASYRNPARILSALIGRETAEEIRRGLPGRLGVYRAHLAGLQARLAKVDASLAMDDADLLGLLAPLGSTVELGEQDPRREYDDTMPVAGSVGVVVGYDFGSERPLVVAMSRPWVDIASDGHDADHEDADVFRYAGDLVRIVEPAVLMGGELVTGPGFVATHAESEPDGREIMVVEAEWRIWAMCRHGRDVDMYYGLNSAAEVEEMVRNGSLTPLREPAPIPGDGPRS